MSPSKFTVLLVEDDPNDRLMTERAFQKLGDLILLHTVNDGEEAIAYLSGKGQYQDRALHPCPGLVLLDLKLPRTSGFEVLGWLRDHPDSCRVPVTVLTSSEQMSDIQRAYSLGAVSYMVKPNGFDQLMSMANAIYAFWVTFSRRPEGD